MCRYFICKDNEGYDELSRNTISNGWPEQTGTYDRS